MALMGMAVFALLCFLLLVVLYWNNERKRRLHQQKTRADIADLSILFQTMRDIIAQQKTLAREFNQELDKKMHLVKQVLARGMEKNEKLYDRQMQLQQILEDAQARLESLQRQLAFLREAVDSSTERLGKVEELTTHAERYTPPAPALPRKMPPPFSPGPPPRTDRIAEELSAPVYTAPTEPVLYETPTAPPAVTRPISGPDTASFESWIAPDFLNDLSESKPEPAPPLPPTPPAPPEAPGDAEAARRAFRALLDLEAEPTEYPVKDILAQMPSPTAAPPPSPPPPLTLSEPPAPRTAESGGNGARMVAPLQKRVLEYSEAGMSLAEISRELGIGKGEVRLMLSLAKQPDKS